MIRASTIALNASSATAANPNRRYADSSTSHKTWLAVPTTTAPGVESPDTAAESRPRSKACCPACSRSRATCINTASSASL
jgi:hypothetical protein